MCTNKDKEILEVIEERARTGNITLEMVGALTHLLALCDINTILIDLTYRDYEFLYGLIAGIGFIPYSQWSLNTVVSEFLDRTSIVDGIEAFINKCHAAGLPVEFTYEQFCNVILNSNRSNTNEP